MITAKLLLSRTYSHADQLSFARLSGDFNPIHIDAAAARRTLTGALTVHGLNLALTGLEVALRAESDFGEAKDITLIALRSDFLKPVLVGDEVSFHRTASTAEIWKIEIRAGKDLLCEIQAKFGMLSRTTSSKSIIPPLREQSMRDLSFDELITDKGEIPLGVDPSLAKSLFPTILHLIGLETFAEILAMTRLVGMYCPGLHSLFGGFDVECRHTLGLGTLAYNVEKADERFQSLLLSIKGGQTEGRVRVFCRPPPKNQPSIQAVARQVKAGEFSGSVSLIVGGSRGLGEITAKIIAAGGGFPILTYHAGGDDAKKVASDIVEWGGRCEVISLDVLHLEGVLKNFGMNSSIRSIYYFATPRISKRRSGIFDFRQFQEFNQYYTVAFGQLIEMLAAQTKFRLSIFYPSSIYAQEAPRDLVEYGMAKRIGEDICAFYNRFTDTFHIIAKRLPRVQTDQTAALFDTSDEDGLSVMLPIVRELEYYGRGKPSSSPAPAI